MSVRAENLTIETVLKKGKYVIPSHQRQYAWEISHLESFVDDISKYEESSYFIGHMVCTGKFNESEFRVVDGQQRITTITIMLCVLRDIFFNKESLSLANGIHGNYIFSKGRDDQEYVVLVNQQPYPILQKYVQNIDDNKDKNICPTNEGERRIIEAYKFFFLKWKDSNIKVLEGIRNKILDLEIIFVVTPDERKAFSIFETLNARGKPLDQLDLIKNQIYKHYESPASLDEPNDSWKEILKNSSQGRKFLDYFWASKYGKVANKKIYEKFEIESKKDGFSYEEFTKNLREDSRHFEKIVNPNVDAWDQNKQKIYFSLSSIKNLKIEVANSFLISLLREFDDKKISEQYFRKALKKIERFHFVFNTIAGERSSGLDSKYSKISRDLHSAPNKNKKHAVIDCLIQELKQKLPNKDTFLEQIDQRLYYHAEDKKYKKAVQYALYRLEYEKQNYNVSLRNLSIEHILSENSDNSSDNIKNIGNLVLLDAGINSKIGNKDYSTKREIVLRESTIITTSEVFRGHKKWDAKEIKDRKNRLIKELFKF
jgi:uncharacterized protein with ParB-like and HNH nuclease domain